MRHKVIWKGQPMRFELTRVSLLVELTNHYTTRGALVIYEALCFDVAQGRMNRAPNETIEKEIVNEALDTVTKGLLQRLEDLGNKRTSGNYSNYSTAEVGQNPTKNPGNLIGLLSLFNGISTFVGYLMPKPFFYSSRRAVVVIFNP